MSDPERFPCDLLVRSATRALDESYMIRVRSLTVSPKVKISESIHPNPALWQIHGPVIYGSMNKTSHIRFSFRSLSHMATHRCQTPAVAVREAGISQPSKIKVVVGAFFPVSGFFFYTKMWSGVGFGGTGLLVCIWTILHIETHCSNKTTDKHPWNKRSRYLWLHFYTTPLHFNQRSRYFVRYRWLLWLVEAVQPVANTVS